MAWIRPFRDLTLDDVESVGGKNASVGELLRELTPLGVRVPDGFAVTADAHRAFLRDSRVEGVIRDEDSIRLNPDALVRTTLRILEMENGQ
jgi:pyruvate,water dikinase